MPHCRWTGVKYLPRRSTDSITGPSKFPVSPELGYQHVSGAVIAKQFWLTNLRGTTLDDVLRMGDEVLAMFPSTHPPTYLPTYLPTHLPTYLYLPTYLPTVALDADPPCIGYLPTYLPT